jgi:hypothetical protein
MFARHSVNHYYLSVAFEERACALAALYRVLGLVTVRLVAIAFVPRWIGRGNG